MTSLTFHDIRVTNTIPSTQNTLITKNYFEENQITGSQGYPGEQGLKGINGEQGPIGDSNIHFGKEGKEGTEGNTGEQGAQGLPGLDGIQGLIGDKGSTLSQNVFAMNIIGTANEINIAKDIKIILPIGNGASITVNKNFQLDSTNHRITYIGDRQKYFWIHTSLCLQCTVSAASCALEVRKNGAAISHAKYSMLSTRAHFDAQDFNIVELSKNDYIDFQYIKLLNGTLKLAQLQTSQFGTSSTSSTTKIFQLIIMELLI
jgi:hypothetical protein